MFNRRQSGKVVSHRSGFLLEGLETRRLMSASAPSEVILFSSAPTAVETGLQTLAGSTTIPANQKVHENTTPDGTTIYVIKLKVSGTPTLYAVDSTGDAVPVPPAKQPPQKGGSNSGGTATGANTIVLFSAAPTAVQTGLQTLVGSTTIPANQKVHENTTPDGTEIYCIKITVDGTSTLYAVDATGAAVAVPPPQQQPPQQGGSTGETSGGSMGSSGTGDSGSGSGDSGTTGNGAGSDTIVLFSAAPSAVQTGLQTLAGSTTIPADQKVHENTTPDGTVIYVIKLVVSGTPTLYAVDATGASVPVPPPPPAAQSGSSSGSSTGSSTGSQGGTGGSQQTPPAQGSGGGQQKGPQGGQKLPPPPPPQGGSSSDGDSSAS